VEPTEKVAFAPSPALEAGLKLASERFQPRIEELQARKSAACNVGLACGNLQSLVLYADGGAEATRAETFYALCGIIQKGLSWSPGEIPANDAFFKAATDFAGSFSNAIYWSRKNDPGKTAEFANEALQHA